MLSIAKALAHHLTGTTKSTNKDTKTNIKKSSQLVSSPSTPLPNDLVVFHIKPFKDNDHGASHRDTVCKNLVSLKHKKIIFFIKGNNTNIKFFVALPRDFKHFFQNTFYANFPTSDLVEVNESLPQNQHYISVKDPKQIFEKEAFQREGTYMDPFNTLLSLYTTIDEKSSLNLSFSYTFKIKKTFLQKVGEVLKRMRVSKKPATEEMPKPEEEDKPDLFCSFGFSIGSSDPYLQETTQNNIKSSFSTFINDGVVKVGKKPVIMPMKYTQIVNFFHIPTMEHFIKGLDYTLYRKLPYPTNVPTVHNTPNAEKQLTLLGKTDYRGDSVTFGIREEDKFRHMYVIGKTGTGKSTLLENLIASDMKAGNGLCVLDPHGELVDHVLEYIPSNRINDVILFDVSDTDFPLGFNLFQANSEDERNLVASGIVATFNKLFGNSWGPRLEYILRNVVLSLVEYPNATLMHILRVLIDKNFREEVVSNVKDSVVLKFWRTEFDKRNDKQRDEAIAPITNKVGQFLSSKLVRNIFGQPKSRLNLRKAMDEGKIILVNLSKGRIGEDNANMIGSLLVTKFQIDAMSRADMPTHLRRPFYLYIDEFQNFMTGGASFASILSEARKYKLALIIANQYVSQLEEDVKDAIFGNVGTTICMTIGSDDAANMTKQFKNLAEVNDLISLPKYTAYTRLMIDGISSDPFSMKTLPPAKLEGSLEIIDKVRKQSRQRYAMSRDQLEKLMAARNSKTFSIQEKVAEKAKLEALGISPEEAENLQDMYIQQHMHTFTEYMIDGVEPDAIIFDVEKFAHKAIWYTLPKGLLDQANLKYKAQTSVALETGKQLPIRVDMYHHQTIITDNGSPLTIWIGSREDIKDQLDTMMSVSGDPHTFWTTFKICPNLEKIQKEMTPVVSPTPEGSLASTQTSSQTTSSTHTPIQQTATQAQAKPSTGPVLSAAAHTVSPISVPPSAPITAQTGAFSIDNIKIGDTYEGYVKLSYNYGMFVTVKGVEGLLHKNFIVAPDGVDWKKYYNIGDKITVKAVEFKDVNGEKRVVWSQK